MSVDAGSATTEDLVAAAQGGAGVTPGVVGTGPTPIPGGEWGYGYTPLEQRLDQREIRQGRRGWQQARKGLFDWNAMARQVQQQSVWNQHLAERAANIANLPDGLAVAQRLHQMGMVYPWLPGDAAVGLAYGGASVGSPAATAAATAAAAQPTTPAGVKDSPVITTPLTVQQANDFASVNSDLADTDLLAALMQRGFNPAQATAYVFDPNTQTFRASTDTDVTVDLRTVLQTEAELQPEDTGGGGLFGWADGITEAIRGTSRWAFATVTAPWEMYSSMVRAEYDGGGVMDALGAVYFPFNLGGVDEAWDETTFAEAMRQAGQGIDAGSGWFMGGSVMANQRARVQAQWAGQMGDGAPATPGRVLTSLVFDPGTTAYNLVSGIGDGIGSLALDPTTWVPGIGITRMGRTGRMFDKTADALDWSKGTTTVERTGDELVRPAPGVAPVTPETVTAPREPGWFRSPDEVPLNASQAVSLEQITPKVFVGGTAHDKALTNLLTAADDAEVEGLLLRTRRNAGAAEAVRIELDPQGLPGYIDTSPNVDWASEVRAGRSSRVRALENAGQLRNRIRTIWTGAAVPAKSKLAKTLDKLINEEGWVQQPVRRKDTGEVVGYRYHPPTIKLPKDADRLNPFHVTDDGRAILQPWAERMDTPIVNLTPHVYGDLDAGTVLAHFPEAGPMDTTKLFDREPLRLVTDPDLLPDEPFYGGFRVRYDAEDLQGKVWTADDPITGRQSRVVEDPEQAWDKPPKPEFDEEQALKDIREEYESYFVDETDLGQKIERSPAKLPIKYRQLREEAERAVHEQFELAAESETFGGHLSFPTDAAKRRFYDHGRVSLEDFLRYDTEVQDGLAYGPGAEEFANTAANRTPVQAGARDNVLGNYKVREVSYAEHEAWARANPAAAKQEAKEGWRLFDHPLEGKRYYVKLPAGVRKNQATVTLPWMDDYNTAAMARRKNQQLSHDWGDDAEHLDWYREQHQERVAEWEAEKDPPTLYSIEMPDPSVKAGQGQVAVGPDSILDFATYATRDRGKAGKAGRAVSLKWIAKGRKTRPRVLDLDTEEAYRAVDAAAKNWFDRTVQYLSAPNMERFTDIYNTEVATARTGAELLRAIRKADRELGAQLGDQLAATARLEEELISGLKAGRFDAVETQDVFHALDPLHWKRTPIKSDKVVETSRTFDEAAATGRFTVGVSGQQEVLRRAPQAIEAPMQRPVSVKLEKWKAWKEQRDRLIGQGWTTREVSPGREQLVRPVTGEYDKKQFDELMDVTDPAKEGRTTPEVPAAMGGSADGPRPFVVPQKFAEFLDTKRGKQLLDDLAGETTYYGLVRKVGRQRAAIMADLLAADTPVKAKAVLLNHVDGGKITSLAGQGRVASMLEDVGDPLVKRMPGMATSLRDIRFTQLMPGPYVNLDNAEEAMLALERYMVTAKLPEALRDDLMKEMVNMHTRFGRKEAFFHTSKVMEAHIATQLQRGFWKGHSAVDIGEVAREAVRFFNAEHEKARVFAVKVHGENAYVSGAKTIGDDLTQANPQLLSEFLNGVLPLPDAREIRRMTSFLGRMTAYGYDTKRAKVLHGLLAMGDWFNRLFKTTALARIAYPVRVGLEEQGRMWAGGYDNLYTHPLSFIMTVAHRKRGLDVFGNKFGDVPIFRADNPLHDPEPSAYAEALVNNSRMWDDPRSVKVVGNEYQVVTLSEPGYWEGWQFELGKLHADPMARRYAGGFKDGEWAAMPDAILEGSPKERVLWWMRNHKQGQEYVQALREADADLAYRLATDDGLASFVDEIAERVDYSTAKGEQQLLDVIATGHLPFDGKKVSLYESVAGGYRPSKQFTTSLKSFTDAPHRPNAVIAENRRLAKDKGTRYDEAVGQFFYQLQGRPTNTLARSPVFRQQYWAQVERLFGGADDAAQSAIIRQAKEARLDGATIRRLEGLQAKGKDNLRALTLEDVDQLSKSEALDTVRELLYDQTRRHHFWDAARMAMPFGEAWHEVMTTWARLVTRNPKVWDRLSHGVHGAQQEGSNVIYEATGTPHDPYQGFFFSDPRTGVESFAWPMPPFLNKYLTAGMPSDATGVLWSAPVGGLNLIGQMYPGFGPIITAPAVALLDGTEGEALRQFLAPFGGPSMEESGGLGNAFVDSVTPAWLRKFMTGTMPLNQEQKNQLASAQMSGMVYLMSSGKYDLSNPDDVDRLLAQGKTLGQRLYQLRALGQFVLPTMGAPDIAAQTADGDLVLQSKLADILRQYQAEPQEGGYGYNEGFLKFLSDFGSDLYFMGVDKTDSTGYASPTRGTYDWMKRNPALVRKFPDVYGLLVEGDTSAFYYPAYQLQINIGSRTLIDPRQLIEDANARIGRALYNGYKSRFGDSISDSEQAELNMLQDKLTTQFPGYSPIPSTIGQTDQLIHQLQTAARDSKVANTRLGQTMATYFDTREAYRQTGIRDFRSSTGREAAADLYALGSQLAQDNPDFQQAWEWLLQRELDVDSLQIGAG